MSTYLNKPHDLLQLFDTLSLREKIIRTVRGLRQHPDSGEYKWARLQILRLWSPTSAVAVPILVMMLLSVLGAIKPETRSTPAVKIVPDEEKLPDLEPPVDTPDPTSNPLAPDTRPTDIVSDTITPDDIEPAPDVECVEKAPSINAVASVISPIKMKKIFSTAPNRGPGGRGEGLKDGGAPPGSEGAVYRALRWLKMNQEEDGSWNGRSGGGQAKGPGAPVAMTGLALLTYLAHGETHQSEEFGETVKGAIEWLLSQQGADGGYDRRYQHAIATYALCETFSMTRLPKVGSAAMKAVDIIIQGQNAAGGWRYKLDPSDENDSSCMGWCVQALKAAKLARFRNGGLDKAIERSVAGFKALYREDGGNSQLGGFGYTSPSIHQLTGVGVLCNQLLGAGVSREARAGLMYLVQTDTFKWEDAKWKNVYYWYYNTQARFNEGGQTWHSWNEQYAKPLMRTQTRINKAAEAPDGRKVDIGYWDTGNEHGGRVMDTVLCTLMLEVYYRYLPTYRATLSPDTPGKDEKNDHEMDIDVTLTCTEAKSLGEHG